MLIEKDYLARANRDWGILRSFVPTTLKHFLSDEWTGRFAGWDGTAAWEASGKLHSRGEVPNGVDNLEGRSRDVAIGSATWILVSTDDR